MGDSAYITDIKGNGAFRKRINEMGFIVGEKVEKVKTAPLRDPVEYRIMGYNVSIRRDEAEMINIAQEKPEMSVPFNMKEPYGQYIGRIAERDNGKTVTKTINVALVGNPNSGKTTIFNYATRSRERVANYGGVTVAAKEAVVLFNGYKMNITDLPGTYSLSSYSPEEMFVTDHLTNRRPDIILNVVDSSNLERNLYLTTQLIDLETRVITILNMYDELQSSNDRFDYRKLGEMLGIPFVPTVGTKGKGIEDVFKTVVRVHEDEESTIRNVKIDYGQDIEEAVLRIQTEIEKDITLPVAPRYLALKLIEGDTIIEKQVASSPGSENIMELAGKCKRNLSGLLHKEAVSQMIDVRYGFINGALQETYFPGENVLRQLTRKIDAVLTHKYLGLPVFFAFVWFMFFCTFKLGQYPMNWIDKGVAWSSGLVSGMLPDGLFEDLIVNGVLGGVGGVAVFLPNIMILFLLISFMEDIGYMARTAFLMDRTMHKAGLHGKSFIPLLMGFGCNVPAIMATRTIESKRDRMLTMLVIPFMSCSARLPVYVLFISAFFPFYRSTLLFSMYFMGILAALITAVIFNRTILRKEDFPFVMELPPYRIPTLKAVLRHTWFKSLHFLKKMGSIILVASIVIWALGYFPRDRQIIGKYDRQIEALEQTDARTVKTGGVASEPENRINELENMKQGELLEQSYISRIGKFLEPVFAPLGFDWKMTVSILTGTLAKEIVVSSMGILYQAGRGADETSVNLISKLRQHRESNNVPLITYFCFLVFTLLYFPCFGTLAAIRKETGKFRWMLVSAVYPLVFAWIATFIIYHAGLAFS